MAREIRYADSDGVQIAYEVFGAGPRDLVFVHGWVTNQRPKQSLHGEGEKREGHAPIRAALAASRDDTNIGALQAREGKPKAHRCLVVPRKCGDGKPVAIAALRGELSW
jgi:hypothetical protein